MKATVNIHKYTRIANFSLFFLENNLSVNIVTLKCESFFTAKLAPKKANHIKDNCATSVVHISELLIKILLITCIMTHITKTDKNTSTKTFENLSIILDIFFKIFLSPLYLHISHIILCLR